jgi:RNA polymerase sigma-70 factor (sigma-E family)
LTRGQREDRIRYEFDEFVAESARDLLRTAYLIVWDLPAAEDVVQECLFEVARRWPRVRTMEYPVAYARRILVNRALAGGKRRGRQRAELDQLDPLDHQQVADGDAELAFGSVETTSDLVDALQTLAPLQRTVLGLRYFEDLSEAQVAETLGCSVGTVKSTTSRALARLRQTPAVAAGAVSRPLPHQ